jgi:hypothetical protein
MRIREYVYGMSYATQSGQLALWPTTSELLDHGPLPRELSPAEQANLILNGTKERYAHLVMHMIVELLREQPPDMYHPHHDLDQLQADTHRIREIATTVSDDHTSDLPEWSRDFPTTVKAELHERATRTLFTNANRIPSISDFEVQRNARRRWLNALWPQVFLILHRRLDAMGY